MAPQDQQPDDSYEHEEEHETHTTALILLVLATLLVLAAAYLLTTSPDFIGEPDTSTTTEDLSTSSLETSGAGVPIRYQETVDTDGLAGLPTGLPVVEDGVVDNYENSFGDGTQRVVNYETDQSASQLYQLFLGWADSSDFSLESQTEPQGEPGSLVLTRNNDRLIVVLSPQSAGSNVQINFINRP